jgi:hypothetical protein
MGSPWGDAALAVALAAHVELLARLRAAEPLGPWWFGYARDGANLAAALMLWGAYLLQGFGGPLALLAATMTCLGTYLCDWLLARTLRVAHPRLWLSVPLVAWVTLLVVAPARVEHALGALLALGRP